MITVVHSHPVWLPQTQTWMYNQVRFLPRDVVSHVVCNRTENLDQFGVPNIHALRARSPLRYLWDRGLVKLNLRSYSNLLLECIRTLRADLVHSHFGPYGWYDMGACKKAGTHQVVTFYGRDVNLYPTKYPEWRDRYRQLFSSADRVLCEGPYMAKCIVSLGCRDEKVEVHRLGIPLDEFPFKPRHWDGQESLKVLLASSFREKKGIPFAIDALARLHRHVELEITVVGDADSTPSSGDEKRRILERIEVHGLQEKVRMLGYQPHAALMAEAFRNHIFMAPSITADDGDSEGGAPVTILEMAATGLPIVSSRHCDIPEIIEHGRSGFLADERDVSGLFRCLSNLVQNPSNWHDLTLAARRHIELNFNAATQGERLARIYECIAG